MAEENKELEVAEKELSSATEDLDVGLDELKSALADEGE